MVIYYSLSTSNQWNLHKLPSIWILGFNRTQLSGVISLQCKQHGVFPDGSGDLTKILVGGRITPTSVASHH